MYIQVSICEQIHIYIYIYIYIYTHTHKHIQTRGVCACESEILHITYLLLLLLLLLFSLDHSTEAHIYTPGMRASLHSVVMYHSKDEIAAYPLALHTCTPHPSVSHMPAVLA
jgi:hypothetical protein